MSDRHAVPGKIQVPPGELRRVAHELGGVAEHLGSGMASLDRFVSGVVGGSWSGDASAAYGAVWRPWHEGASKVADGLMTMSGLLADAAAHFVHSDHTGAAEIRRADDT
jgi:WXG100 family type VII secretion target